jgi:glycosyltransferase involved in cell wall biosynthesis
MADRQLTRPLVSITVPCYHNLAQARRCVSSILAQSWDEFELTLIDDGASDEYRDYVETLRDPRVRYRRNPSRLGAMRNMFQAIAAGSGTYTLAFHEDDLLGAHYLATAVGILEREKSVGFVAAQLREFQNEPSAEQLGTTADPPTYDLFASPADFLRGIFDGLEPMFGSVVYRRAALAGVLPEHDEYGTLVDRPFLMAIMKRWAGAIVRDPLVWYRHHADTVRHEGMSADHIVALFSFYRSTLPAPMSPRDRALFYTYSGYWLFALYDLTPDDRRPSFGRFLWRVWRGGLYQPQWRGRFGLRLLQRAVLGEGPSAS